MSGMERRFLIVGGCSEGSSITRLGGMSDFIGAYDSLEDAVITALGAKKDEWRQVWDRKTGKSISFQGDS